MQQASEAEGWTINYHQIQAGKLEARSFSGECAGITLMDESASRRIEVVGEPPPANLTVLAPRYGTRLWLHGHNVDSRGIALLEPGTDMQLVCSEGANVVSMHIPIAQVNDTCQAMHRRSGNIGRGRITLISPVAEEAARLSRPIRIGDVCAYSMASVSKLERTFRRELQMSPTQYILARRLAATRRELIEADRESATVSRIATGFGFNHLGRLAGAYRKQFGELPSVTLRNGNLMS